MDIWKIIIVLITATKLGSMLGKAVAKEGREQVVAVLSAILCFIVVMFLYYKAGVLKF